MSKSTESPLVAAVKQLDADVRRFEQLSSELVRAPINSEKSLQRARQARERSSTQGSAFQFRIAVAAVR